MATGCSHASPGPVGLPVRASGAAVGPCAQVVRALPTTLSGQHRRATRPASTSTAAWGDPPITLVCGVPAGSPLDDLYELDGVQWTVHDIGAARTWTTRGRRVEVVVTVPDRYDDQAELLGSLASALKPTA